MRRAGSEGIAEAMAEADRRFWIEAGDSALLGALLCLAGLLTVAVLAGWLLARRRGASPSAAVSVPTPAPTLDR